jgi:hypothetical protein
MDTNLVLPLGPRKCQVIFDYFIEAHLKVLSRHMPACVLRGYGMINIVLSFISKLKDEGWFFLFYF